MDNFCDAPENCSHAVELIPVKYQDGIPVFEPTAQEHLHFDKLVKYLDRHYGQFYGAVIVMLPTTSVMDVEGNIAVQQTLEIQSNADGVLRATITEATIATPNDFANQIQDIKALDSLFWKDLSQAVGIATSILGDEQIIYGQKYAITVSETQQLGDYKIYHLQKGSPRIWTIIPPAGMKRYELLCQKLVQPDYEPLVNEFTLISPSLLLQRGIKHRRVQQPFNSLLILCPYTVYHSLDLGANKLMSKVILGESWIKNVVEFAKACTCINDSALLSENKLISEVAPKRMRLCLSNEIDKLLDNKAEFEELENGNIVCRICERCDSIDKEPCPVILYKNEKENLGYCHLVCAIFTENVELHFDAEMISTLKCKRFRSTPLNLWGFEHFVYAQVACQLSSTHYCSLCRTYDGKPKGHTIKCQDPKCSSYMHAICAFDSGHVCYRSMVASSEIFKDLQALPFFCENSHKVLKFPLSDQKWFVHVSSLEQQLPVFTTFCMRHGIVIFNSFRAILGNRLMMY